MQLATLRKNARVPFAGTLLTVLVYLYQTWKKRKASAEASRRPPWQRRANRGTARGTAIANAEPAPEPTEATDPDLDPRLHQHVDVVLELRDRRYGRLGAAGPIEVFFNTLVPKKTVGEEKTPGKMKYSHMLLIFGVASWGLWILGSQMVSTRTLLIYGGPFLVILLVFMLEYMWKYVLETGQDKLRRPLGKVMVRGQVPDNLSNASAWTPTSVIRGSVKVAPDTADRVWQKAFAWVNEDSIGRKKRGFARVGEMGIFVEVPLVGGVDAPDKWFSAAYVLVPRHDGGNGRGVLIECYEHVNKGKATRPEREQIEDTANLCAKSVRVMLPGTNGLSTNTSASNSLSEADKDIADLGKEACAQIAAFATEEGGDWKAEGSTDGVELSNCNVKGHKFPCVRGVMTVPAGSRCPEIRDAIACIVSHSARRVWDSLYDESKVVHSASNEAIVLWVKYRKTPITAERESIQIASCQKSSNGKEFTLSLSTAPPNVVDAHEASITKARQGKTYGSQEVPLWGWHVTQLDNGDLRLAFLFIPPAQGLPLPGFLLKKIIAGAPALIKKVVEMAVEGMIPRVVALTGPEPEETEKVSVNGQTRTVSVLFKCILEDSPTNDAT